MDEAAMMARIADAQRTADLASHSISTHEQVCAERYDGIKRRLDGIPRLFELLEGNRKNVDDKIDKISKLVYMGMGIFISILGTIEVLRYLGK